MQKSGDRPSRHRHECRCGTQECVRHVLRHARVCVRHMLKRISLFDPAAAEHEIAVIEDGRLAGSDGALGVVEMNFNAVRCG